MYFVSKLILWVRILAKARPWTTCNGNIVAPISILATLQFVASEMTYIVSSGALNSTHSLSLTCIYTTHLVSNSILETNERTDGRTDKETRRDASHCPLCLSGASILWGNEVQRTAMLNLRGRVKIRDQLTNTWNLVSWFSEKSLKLLPPGENAQNSIPEVFRSTVGPPLTVYMEFDTYTQT